MINVNNAKNNFCEHFYRMTMNVKEDVRIAAVIMMPTTSTLLHVVIVKEIVLVKPDEIELSRKGNENVSVKRIRIRKERNMKKLEMPKATAVQYPKAVLVVVVVVKHVPFVATWCKYRNLYWHCK